MNRKIIVIIMAVVFVMLVGSLLERGNDEAESAAFHVTLASPDLYNDGVYSKDLVLDGKYSFRFVPNGDSPRVLGISISGETFDFSEDFELVGTLHQTDISEYHTWDYSGQKEITVDARQAVSIKIDPNGNINGPVSVYIIKN